MKNKSNDRFRNSTYYRLSIRFASLLLGIILLLSFSIITITVRELYKSIKSQVELLGQTLETAEIGSRDQWIEVLHNYTSGEDSPYYIRVVLTSGEIIYSQGSREVFEEFPQFTEVLFFNDILFRNDFEPVFFDSFEVDGVQVTLLREMDDDLDLIERIIFLISILTLLGIVIGIFATRQFAKFFSRSLEKMSFEIRELEKDSGNDQLLTEPESPQEVKNVSQSFNKLLMKQRELLKREQQFVTDTSHELRTPVAAIRGHVNLIKRRGEAHPEVIPKSLAFIDIESKRMETMIEQLLTLERKSGVTQKTNFSAIVRQTIEELKVVMTQELTIAITDDVLLLGNKEHFYQIIRNLVENAIKYTEKTGSIIVRLEKEETIARLTVIDNGVGIADEAKTHVFERFYREDHSRSSKIPGSGIGLSIVKELVELYNGTIQVTDAEPKGTCFTITLPTIQRQYEDSHDS